MTPIPYRWQDRADLGSLIRETRIELGGGLFNRTEPLRARPLRRSTAASKIWEAGSGKLLFFFRVPALGGGGRSCQAPRDSGR